VNDLRSGSGKSRQREIAARWRRRERFGMKTNEYRGDFESCALPDPANEPADRSEEHRTMSNRIFARDLPTGLVAAFTGRPQFPLRTLMVCFTIWLIATEAMIFDQVKFDERAHLLEQTARSLGAPQVVVPTERPTNVPNSATTQRL